MSSQKGCVILKSKGYNAYTKYMILQHGLKEDNISKTCELFGISRTSFYNWQKSYEKEGISGLEKKERKKPDMPNKVSKDIEEEILDYVIKYPKDGPRRIYYELSAEGIEVGETGIYNVLKRNKLTRKEERIEYSKKKLYKKPAKKYNKAAKKLIKNKEKHPGYLVTQRVDFIGTFEGIGRVYQYSFYDIGSRWGDVKLFNSKQEIDVWHYFELKLIYLLETFNLNIVNLVSQRERSFLPYFVKDRKHEKISDKYKINHVFLTSEASEIFDHLNKFNEYLVREFYKKVIPNKPIGSFIELEDEMNKFIREYNFNRSIDDGVNKGQTPANIILNKALENETDLDTLPLWLLALIKISKDSDLDG